MAAISASDVKTLRDKTGLGMMTCKEALEASNGDMGKAIEWLRKKGLDAASKRAGRATTEGVIGSYIHTNDKLGVLVEINCESDFVARGDDFRVLAKDIAMHVAASDPIAVGPEDVPAVIVEKEKEIYREQVKNKPPGITEKIVDGKLQKFYAERCLMLQPFVKNTDITVEELVKSVMARTGENIRVRRFVRFQLGEEL